MSDKIVPQVWYTVNPLADPIAGEFMGALKADQNGNLWIRPIATLGAGFGIQTSRHPDSDDVDPAGVIAFDVASFMYVWNPTTAAWDRLEAGGDNADAVAPVANGILANGSRLYAYNGATFDRLQSADDNTDAQAPIGLGVLKILSRLYAYNGATFDRLQSEDDNTDGQAPIDFGVLKVLSRLYAFNGLTWDRLVNVVDNADAQGYLMHLLATMSRLEAFNGATFDRLRTTVDNADNVAAGVVGLLGTMARGLVWNGTNYMRDWKSANFNAVTSSNVGAASASILAASDTRRYLLIQNTHATQTLYINFGAAASATTLAIIAGGNYEPLVVPTDEIFAYGSGAATTFVIVSA
jgi:hypothetical protein